MVKLPFMSVASAAKRAVRSKFQERWAKQWKAGRTAAPTRRLVQAPSRKIMELYGSLPKEYASGCVIMFDEITARTDLGATTDYDSIISDPQAIRYVAEFMLQTGLLGQFSQVELDPDPDPDLSQEHKDPYTPRIESPGKVSHIKRNAHVGSRIWTKNGEDGDSQAAGQAAGRLVVLGYGDDLPTPWPTLLRDLLVYCEFEEFDGVRDHIPASNGEAPA
ncbi:hypothetical protein AAWM_08470 [Aspergillus awamori]|uniref:Uncharacterized protein n=1 Tax=Aspergillus awamori TaxID=105351 RepID=A0A401L240_ASPAW|nr:hypothetical protein AAWM_08470 [Aspergillus awamori]